MKQIVSKSNTLQVFQYLQGRMDFAKHNRVAFYNARQGYEGEKKLAQYLENLTCDYVSLYDLLLNNNGTIFQIDCLLIFPREIAMLEVKNHQGEFEFRDGRLYSYTINKHYTNPLYQLQRSDVNF